MEKLKNQSESHKQAEENLHDQVQEQKAHLRAAQDRVLSLEANINELSSQLNESKEKVSQLDIQVSLLSNECDAVSASFTPYPSHALFNLLVENETTN